MMDKRIIVVACSVLILTAIAALGLRHDTQTKSSKGPADQPYGKATGEVAPSMWVPLPVSGIIRNSVEMQSIAQERLAELSTAKLIGHTEAILLKMEKIRTASAVMANLSEPGYIDTDGDGQISYGEYNDKTYEISMATYDIRHQIYLGDDPALQRGTIMKDLDPERNMITGSVGRILRPKDLMISGSEAGMVLVVVEGGIFEKILPELSSYETSAEKETGYDYRFMLCNDCSPGWIKEQARSQAGIQGLILIGVTPAFWQTYEVKRNLCIGDWCLWIEKESYPSDLFFMDLFSEVPEYLDKVSLESLSQGPLIQFGRMYPPSELTKVLDIQSYLTRNILYRERKLPLKASSIIYRL